MNKKIIAILIIGVVIASAVAVLISQGKMLITKDEQREKLLLSKGADKYQYEDEYIYSMNMMSPQVVRADRRFEYLKKKFNVDFTFRPANWSNWNEKIRIWTASDDMPDIMWLKFQENNFSEYVNWAKQGAYKPLPDLPELREKYPNLHEVRQKMSIDDYWEVDGKLYAWPIYINSVEWRDPLVSS